MNAIEIRPCRRGIPQRPVPLGEALEAIRAGTWKHDDDTFYEVWAGGIRPVNRFPGSTSALLDLLAEEGAVIIRAAVQWAGGAGINHATR